MNAVDTNILIYVSYYSQAEIEVSKMKNKLSVKILQEGDQVLNVWPSGAEIYIAVRSRNEEVFVYAVTQDQNGQPKLSKAPEITITYGDGEVEAWATDASGKQIFSLTA